MEPEALEREAGAANDGGAKRRQIMDGARQVFLSAGFDGASMNDIARAAGVSKGTLYAYFNSKDALFEAIIRGEYAQSAERLCIFRREGDARDMLKDFGVRLISKMADPYTRALARVVIAAAEKFPNVGRAFYEAGPLYGATRLAAELENLEKLGALNGARPGARRLAVCRPLPELCLQAPDIRRRRTRSAARRSRLRSRRGSTSS